MHNNAHTPRLVENKIKMKKIQHDLEVCLRHTRKTDIL